MSRSGLGQLPCSETILEERPVISELLCFYWKCRVPMCPLRADKHRQLGDSKSPPDGKKPGEHGAAPRAAQGQARGSSRPPGPRGSAGRGWPRLLHVPRAHAWERSLSVCCVCSVFLRLTWSGSPFLHPLATFPSRSPCREKPRMDLPVASRLPPLPPRDEQG